MSALQEIAYFQGRRDEVPNQELARRLAQARDVAGIGEIAAGLWHKDGHVRSDCLKVLYEIGYLEPALIADYVEEFVRLLDERNNRLVWGSLIALSTIANLRSAEIYAHVPAIQHALKYGSVIAVDNAVKTLARVAAADSIYQQALLPGLLEHLASCRPKDVSQHAESTLLAIDAPHAPAFIQTLETRLPDLSASQAARVRKVIKSAGQL